MLVLKISGMKMFFLNRQSARTSSAVRRARDDDLADEIEAIRLAADLSSRRLLQEQKGSSATTSSSTSSRARSVTRGYP